MESKTSIPTKTYERMKNKTSRPISKCGELPDEYKNVCRLCLKEHNYMYDILQDDDIVPIITKIKTLVNVRIEEDDELPTLICANCFVEINEFYKFKKQCIANDIQLRQCLLKMPCKRIDNWSNKSLDLENSCSDPTMQKNNCTINWDDQVPLAGMIITKFENLKKVKERPIIKSLCMAMPAKNASLTKDSDPKTLEEQQVRNYPALQENDYDEMPLAQRLIASKMIEDEVIQNSKHKNSKNITNLEIESKVCKRLTGKDRKKCCSSQYTCLDCPKTFSCLSTLNRHYRVHTGERPFSCGLCDAAFSQKESLDRHVKQVHSTSKPYECEYCGKRFSIAYLLNNHVKFHTRKSKYHCEYCPKVFTHASGLSRHKRYHTGTRYTCTVCKKNFVDPSSMKRHKTLLHGQVIKTINVTIM